MAHRWHHHGLIKRRLLEGWIDNLSVQDYETLIGFPGPGRSVQVGVRYQV